MDAEAKELRFFQKNIEGLEHKGRDLHIGKCPACGRKELRVFEADPVEVRCAKCNLWAFGIEEFARKVKEMNFPINRPIAGSCEICQAPFPRSLNVRRPPKYCSPRCRKRAERARKRGII